MKLTEEEIEALCIRTMRDLRRLFAGRMSEREIREYRSAALQIRRWKRRQRRK